MTTEPAVWQDVACPLCGRDDWRLHVWAPSHYGPEKLRVTRCRHCQMIYTNPQCVLYEKEVEHRGKLDRHFSEQSLEKSRRCASLLLGMLAKVAPGRRLLDFGAGAGVLVDEARKQGWDAAGVDLNKGLVEAAKKYWGFDAIFAGSLEAFTATDPKLFDAVVSYQVIEHIPAPLRVGRALVEMLNPRGVLYIDVPYARQPAELLSRGKSLDPTSHANHFTLRTLRSLVTRLGCEVVSSSAAPSLVGLYNRLGLRRLCYPLGRLSKRLLPPVGTGVCVIGRKP